MPIRACGPRLVLKCEEVPNEEVSEGGIVLTTEKKLRKAAVETGIVVSVGQTCWNSFYYGDQEVVPWCKVGDYISYARYAGKVVTDPITKENFTVINDEDVVSIIETKEERDAANS